MHFKVLSKSKLVLTAHCSLFFFFCCSLFMFWFGFLEYNCQGQPTFRVGCCSCLFCINLSCWLLQFQSFKGYKKSKCIKKIFISSDIYFGLVFLYIQEIYNRNISLYSCSNPSYLNILCFNPSLITEGN